MDVIKKIESLKDKKLREDAEEVIRKTLEMNDEEFYFDEETALLAAKKYVKDHLNIVNGFYQVKGDVEKINYCMVCWDSRGQMNKVKKNKDNMVCLVCNLDKK